MIFGPREKSCYSKIMLWKSATKNFYSVIISHYTRENFYSVIISHYTREKCNHKKFQCYISLLMYIHTDKIFVHMSKGTVFPNYPVQCWLCLSEVLVSTLCIMFLVSCLYFFYTAMLICFIPMNQFLP